MQTRLRMLLCLVRRWATQGSSLLPRVTLGALWAGCDLRGFRGATGAEWEAKGVPGLMEGHPRAESTCVRACVCEAALLKGASSSLTEGLTEHFPVVSFNCYCNL